MQFDFQFSITPTSKTIQTEHNGYYSQDGNVRFFRMFGTLTRSRNVWIYDGSYNEFNDFSAKGTDRGLVVTWDGRKKIDLKTGPAAGSCAGVMKTGNITNASISCETSGTLLNAFFTNTNAAEQVVA